MKKFLRALRFFFFGLLGLSAFGGGVFGYFIYTLDPELPQFSGTLTKAIIEIGGLKRTCRTYLPKGLAKGVQLVIVMHGTGQNGARINDALARITLAHPFQHHTENFLD